MFCEDSYLDAHMEDVLSGGPFMHDPSLDGDTLDLDIDDKFFDEDAPEDHFRDDADADADALASAGFGTDEDYGGGCDYGDEW